MPDIGLHQGAGLHCDTPAHGLRLVATLSAAQAPAPDVLWQLCAQLQRLGYPTLVLDGTSAETDACPGLAHLLAQAPWSASALLAGGGGADAASLAVLPALHGLRHLAAQEAHLQPPLQPLQALFRAYAVVVLHASVELLASPLLAGLTTAPLLLLQPGAQGVLEGYRQLKHLALNTGLAGTVACLAPAHDAARQRQASEALASVRSCAAQHLGQRIGTTLVQEGSAPDLQRLALLLLENAATLLGSALGAARGADAGPGSPCGAEAALYAPQARTVQPPTHSFLGH